jgi:uncharacterized membrane protein YdjX (TVP38/TMEM64 family)
MSKPSIFNSNAIRFSVLVFLIVFCWSFGKLFEIDFDRYKTLLLEFPLIVSGFIFILLYVGITFFAWLTKDIFKILGAVLFGAYLSTLMIWLAEAANAVILFHLSRKLGRGFVENQLKGKLANLDQKIEEVGFWGLFALRIVPLVPFRFLDLATGLTKISFRKYFMIVLLGSPLRIFWIQFILAGVGEKILHEKDILQLFPILVEYLLNSQFIFLLSFVYLITAIFIGIKLKKK